MQELTDEEKRNLADFGWRIRNLYTLVTDEGVEMPFVPNEEQLAFADNIWYRNLILKARQLGFTTLIDVIALDQCLFNDNFTAVIIADSRENAEKIFRNQVKRVYERLPELVGRSRYRTAGWRQTLVHLAAQQGLSTERILQETDPSDLMEGLYVKVEEEGRVLGRYKYVRASFLTAVLDSGSHWLSRPIVPNQLRAGVDLWDGPP